jgi:hypothetical protein
MVARDPNRGIIPGCLVSYAVRLTDQVRMSRTPTGNAPSWLHYGVG